MKTPGIFSTLSKAAVLCALAIGAQAQAQDIKIGFNGDLSASPSAQSGQAAVLGLRNQTNQNAPITVYGPPGTRELVAGMVASMQPAARVGYGIPGQPWKAPAETAAHARCEDHYLGRHNQSP